ncbi:unnamed protein product [Gulo gulo]|uniref:Uncharacterized protein n=1 Tax=Gulo gulo TaxID=48420 RepID=A0A9X9LL89_GULGU|nr:unnamed protein product [Gulo gulo]
MSEAITEQEGHPGRTEVYTLCSVLHKATRSARRDQTMMTAITRSS